MEQFEYDITKIILGDVSSL